MIAAPSRDIASAWRKAESRPAKRPPSETHPFGYAMESYFWSFLVAVMLFSLGGLFSIYEGLHKLEEVHEPAEHGGGHFAVAIVVLLVSIVLEGISWWVATKEVNRHRGKLGLLHRHRVLRRRALVERDDRLCDVLDREHPPRLP